MLPFKNRLTKKRDIEKVQRMGQFFSSGNLTLKVAINGTDITRIGFLAGLKFSRRAVERNQIKRKLRGIFRDKLREIKKGLDIVVMARKREGEKIKDGKLKEDADLILKKGNLTEKAV